MRYFGDIILAQINYTDSSESKKRPALVLFEDHGNIVVAGITSNLSMKGVLIKRDEGMLKDSIIKLNYIFTIDSHSILKDFFTISDSKKRLIKEEFFKKLK